MGWFLHWIVRPICVGLVVRAVYGIAQSFLGADPGSWLLERAMTAPTASELEAARWLVVLLVSIPILIWLEYLGRQKVTTDKRPNRHNMKVSDAIDYIVNDSIAILRKANSCEPRGSHPPGTVITVSGVEHEDARAQLNAKLNTGEIGSWGLRQINTHIPNQFELSLREIPIEYWGDMQLDFQSCLYYKGPYAQTMKIPGKPETYHWAEITLSKAQIEHYWPKKSALISFCSKLMRKQRIRHATSFSTPENK